MRGGYQSGPRSHGRQITKQLEVPNELIGTIIGRHGMKISEIRQALQPSLPSIYHRRHLPPEEEDASQQWFTSGCADWKSTSLYDLFSFLYNQDTHE